MAKPYRLASEGNQNLKSVSTKDSSLKGYSVTNGGTEVRFLKLYDKAEAPVLAEDKPVLAIAVPPGTTVERDFSRPFPFYKGIAHSIVKKLADTNAEGVTAAELSVTLWYD